MSPSFSRTRSPIVVGPAAAGSSFSLDTRSIAPSPADAYAGWGPVAPHHGARMITANAATFHESVDVGALLASVVDYLRALVRTKPAPDDEHSRFARYALSAIGSTLLDARSERDLHDRLEGVVTGPTLHQITALSLQYLGKIQPRDFHNAGEELNRAFSEILPAQAAARLTAESELLEFWLAAPLRFARAHPTAIVEAAEQGATEYELLADPDVPPAILHVWYEASAASACLLALALAAERRRQPNPNVACAMVDTILRGARSHLRLLAAFPDTGVPERLVPDPMDVEMLFARRARANAVFGQQLRALDDEAP